MRDRAERRQTQKRLGGSAKEAEEETAEAQGGSGGTANCKAQGQGSDQAGLSRKGASGHRGPVTGPGREGGDNGSARESAGRPPMRLYFICQSHSHSGADSQRRPTAAD